MSKNSHDLRCLLEDNSICQIQFTCQFFDFLDRAGWDSLDLDDDRRAGFVNQDAFDALPQGTELILRQASIERKLQAGVLVQGSLRGCCAVFESI